MHRYSMLSKVVILCGILVTALLCVQPAAPDSPVSEPLKVAADLGHGRKLYEQTCDACHSANVHWREKRLVTSWGSLLYQVTRWQANAGQRWEEGDIKDVAAYLNEQFYHLPCPASECAEKQAQLRSQ